MPKRRDWMIDIIGPHIPPAGRIMKKIWNFSDVKFRLLIGSVYGT
jgi:hypothetical protein